MLHHAGGRQVLRHEGDVPVRVHRLVQEWAERYKPELLDMWTRQEFRNLPGLE
jgi:hypothetical protein